MKREKIYASIVEFSSEPNVKGNVGEDYLMENIGKTEQKEVISLERYINQNLPQRLEEKEEELKEKLEIEETLKGKKLSPREIHDFALNFYLDLFGYSTEYEGSLFNKNAIVLDHEGYFIGSPTYHGDSGLTTAREYAKKFKMPLIIREETPILKYLKEKFRGKTGESLEKEWEEEFGCLVDPMIQSEVFSTRKVITEKFLDGFMGPAGWSDYAPKTKVNRETNTIPIEGRMGDVTIIDSRRDPALEELYEWAREIKDLPAEEKAFLIARKVYNRMGKNGQEVKYRAHELYESKAEVLIGEIKWGVCRHRARLFHALAKEAGIDTCLRLGYLLIPLSASGGHEWNEIVSEDGKTKVVDVMHPAVETGDFGVLTYEQYRAEGGFPDPDTSRLGHVRYLDRTGERIYSGTVKTFTKEETDLLRKTLLTEGYSEEEVESMVWKKIRDEKSIADFEEESMSDLEKRIKRDYSRKAA